MQTPHDALCSTLYREAPACETAHGMTPAEYRQAFGLSADYPMTTQSYSERRSDMAKSIGLGSQGRKAASEAPKAEPKKRKGRKPKEAAQS